MDDIFKNQISNDLNNVFLNTDEFADPHNINGIDGVKCIIDTYRTSALRPGLSRFEGNEKDTMMLFISEANWPGNVVNGTIVPSVPAFRQVITVDLVRWRIVNLDLFNGMYEILLEAVK